MANILLFFTTFSSQILLKLFIKNTKGGKGWLVNSWESKLKAEWLTVLSVEVSC